MTYTCPCGKVYGTGTDDDKISVLKRYCPVCTKQLVNVYGEHFGVLVKTIPNKKSEV